MRAAREGFISGTNIQIFPTYDEFRNGVRTQKTMRKIIVSTICAAATVVLWTLSCAAEAEDNLPQLLDQLTRPNLDDSVLYAIETHPSDPSILPALRNAFEKQTRWRERRAIAVTLVRLGDKSDVYLHFA